MQHEIFMFVIQLVSSHFDQVKMLRDSHSIQTRDKVCCFEYYYTCIHTCNNDNKYIATNSNLRDDLRKARR